MKMTENWLPIASETILMILFILVDTIDSVWRNWSNALGANVFASRLLNIKKNRIL